MAHVSFLVEGAPPTVATKRRIPRHRPLVVPVSNTPTRCSTRWNETPKGPRRAAPTERQERPVLAE